MIKDLSRVVEFINPIKELEDNEEKRINSERNQGKKKKRGLTT